MAVSKEIFFVSSTVALVYSGMTLIFPVLPFYLEEFGGGAKEFGIAAAAFALAVLIFSPLLGRLADRHGKVKMITFSLIGYALTNFLYIFVSNYWHIIFLRFIEGLSTAGVAPAGISIASDLSEEKNRARSIALVTAGISFGVIVGPLIGGTLILYYPLWFPFIISGIMGLIAAVVSRTMKEPTPEFTPDLSMETEHEAIESRLKKILRQLPQPLSSFIVVLIIKMIVGVAWLLIEPGFVYYFYGLGYSSQQFGIFVAIYGFFVFFGEIVLGGLSDKFGRKIIIVVGSVVYAGFYVYLAFVTPFVNLIIAASIAGIALGLVGPALNALISEISPPNMRTYVFGIATAFSGVAQVLGPLIGGWVVDGGFPVTQLSLVSSALVLFSAFLVYFVRFSDRL